MQAGAEGRHAEVTEISPAGRSLRADLRELWRYRDLLELLTSRDVNIRYKQSAIGMGWAVLQPLALMFVFTVVFGRFAKLPSDGVPYPLFVISGLLPWQYFSRSLTGSSQSLVTGSALVSKVYFPRLILPVSKTFSGLFDLGIGFVLLALAMAWYRVAPSWTVLMLPVFVAISMLSALAVGLWLTALNARFRDVGIMVPFMLQVWMFMSPVAYSAKVVPQHLKLLYSLNPMVGVIDGFRWALLGKAPPDPMAMAASLLVMLLLLVTGLAYFRRAERTFADVV